MDAYEEFYRGNNFSSSHFLFLTPEERAFFQNRDYLIRESFQYHFINQDYATFENFLSSLKSKKAKQIRKERVFAEGIEIEWVTHEKLTQRYADEMYEFYLATIKSKQAIAYLNQTFFRLVFESLSHNVGYVRATREGEAIGGALFFYDQNRLYGRYWGAKEHVPNLHFELCYYQGIDFCLKKKLAVFEAGAQGEHKISRGFTPVKTFSAHKLKHPAFHQAVERFINSECLEVERAMAILARKLPFK